MTHNWVVTAFIPKRGSWQMMYVVTSHHMHHLPEVQDDVFDITYWVTSVGESANRHILACNSETTYGFGL